MPAPGGERSLLRRLPGAYRAALTVSRAWSSASTRVCASQDATAGEARADGGDGEAAIPGSKARAPAVAIAAVVAVLCFAPAALADESPPPTPPASTTPDAPPPDPYHPPAPSSKPKTSAPKRSVPVVHSAPTPRTRSYAPPVTQRSYTPPVTHAAAPVRSAPTHRVKHARVKKPAHKPRKHVVVHRHVAPKPVKVTFAPFADLVATADISLSTDDGGRRDRYLQFAGLAFALLAAAGLSLHVTALRSAGVTR
jgi:hypothetical protein